MILLLNDRKGISLVLFDLPVANNMQIREYNRFRAFLKDNGYRQLQKSVYIKLLRDSRYMSDEAIKIEGQAPEDGNVCIIPFTLNMFKKSKFIGNCKFDMSVFSDDIVII